MRTNKMIELINAANGMTWPGAIVVSVIVVAVAWVFVTLFKNM